MHREQADRVARAVVSRHNRVISLFSYSETIVEDFPAIRGGVVLVTGMKNQETPEAVFEALSAEHDMVRGMIGDTPLSEIPSLAAWRRAFSRFGVKPTQYRSAAEALLRRLTKQGDLPSINLAVDLANTVSVRHGLPIAVFDQQDVSGGTTVRYSDGTEEFTDLGTDTSGSPDEGEVIFVDDAGLVSARRWCWRQSRQSATGLSTTIALFTIEGQHPSAEDDVARASEDLVALLQDHLRHETLSLGLLSPDRPEFDGQPGLSA